MFAGTTLPNARSITLFETFGFKQIAHQERVGFKLGAWHDVVWMELQLQERTVPPPSSSLPSDGGLQGDDHEWQAELDDHQDHLGNVRLADDGPRQGACAAGCEEGSTDQPDR